MRDQTPKLTEAEFNQVVARVMKALPTGLSESEFDAALAQAVRSEEAAKRQSQPTGPEGGAAGRFASNLISGLNPLPILKYAVPGFGAKWMAEDLASGATDQARKALKSESLPEAVGHGAAAVLPLVGPAAALAGEQIAGGDVAGGLGSTAAMLAPGAANLVKPGVLRLARQTTPALERIATKNLVESVAPSIGREKTRLGNIVAKAAPEVLRDPELGAWSQGAMMEKLGRKAQEAKAGLDAASAGRPVGADYPTSVIASPIRSARQRLVMEPLDADVVPRQPAALPTGWDSSEWHVKRPTPEPYGREVVPSENRSAFEYYTEKLDELERLGPTASYESLRRFRDAADKTAERVYTPAIQSDFLSQRDLGRAGANVAGAARDFLADVSPETATANRGYHTWENLHRIAQATEEAERVRPRRGLKLFARSAGAAAGGVPGAALGAGVEYMANSGFTTKIQAARLLTRLQDALASGDFGTASAIAAEMKIAGLTGGDRAVEAQRQTLMDYLAR